MILVCRQLEAHQLTQVIFASINAHLEDRGLLLREGTVVDASIIAAPSSTKNQTGQRDPEMHQTRKGKQWYFGMKAHIGVDLAFGVTHTLVTTPAQVSDVTQAMPCCMAQSGWPSGMPGTRGWRSAPVSRPALLGMLPCVRASAVRCRTLARAA